MLSAMEAARSVGLTASALLQQLQGVLVGQNMEEQTCFHLAKVSAKDVFSLWFFSSPVNGLKVQKMALLWKTLKKNPVGMFVGVGNTYFYYIFQKCFEPL